MKRRKERRTLKSLLGDIRLAEWLVVRLVQLALWVWQNLI